MNEDSLPYMILAVLGFLGSLVAYAVKKFMSDSKEKFDKHGDRIDRLEIKIGEQNERNIAIDNTLHRIELFMDKQEKKFADYDKERLEYYKNKK